MEYAKLLLLLEENLNAAPDYIWNISLFSDGSGELFFPSDKIALTHFNDIEELENYVNALIESVSNKSSALITSEEAVEVLMEVDRSS